ncbi:hypothetical protein BGX27_003764 [Mortierella sp. AM989]|nr:hypothetical protein BGX27_003764 [Mortierella sp. AM989]
MAEFNFKELYSDVHEVIKEIRGASYFFENHPSNYHPRKYVQSIGAFGVSNPAAVSKDYNRIIDEFQRSKHHFELYEFAMSAKRMNKATVKYYCSAPIAREIQEARSEDIRTEVREDPDDLDDHDLDESEISLSSLSRVSSVLCSSSLDAMKEEYAEAFEKYCGPSFMLPSGRSFDAAIYRHVMEDLKKQSLLHSSILDSSYRDELLNLFLDGRDSQAIADRLDELVEIVKTKYQVPDWQKDVIRRYTSVQAIKETLFKGLDSVFTVEGVSEDVHRRFVEMIFDCMKGVLNFYEDYGQQYQLPVMLSERSYMTLWTNFFRILYKDQFNFSAGEVSSKPSAIRKNKNRKKKKKNPESASQQSGAGSQQSGADNRQSGGRRSDGVATTKNNNIEILLIECGPKDNGPNGTKTLADGFKIAKGLKDIYDFIMNEVSLNGGDIAEAMEKIEVYGVLVSGGRIQFVTIRYFGGRFLFFDRGHIESLPLTLNDETLAKIRRMVIYFLQQREQMADCDRVIGKLINIGSLNQQKYEGFPTLTTPPSSPKLKKMKC